MRLFFKLSAVLFAAAILYLSLQPSSGMPGPLYADKVQHAVAYGSLTLFTALGWPKIRLVYVVIIAIAFGIGIEIAQGLGAQGRMMSVYDAIANGAGAGITAIIVRIFRK
ncbi:VanZ superfamily protein [Algimonas arctica]|uniref:VanZ superfamily protein n=1 Tax=Algimonas arctica TaxID=1479486 RepID=A0A8J3G1R5_9PROT|nr:VanZ family protein [Algimonas arctica]GHA88341.1 VanZ superfamily protein [Algimonas arctica]